MCQNSALVHHFGTNILYDQRVSKYLFISSLGVSADTCCIYMYLYSIHQVHHLINTSLVRLGLNGAVSLYAIYIGIYYLGSPIKDVFV